MRIGLPVIRLFLDMCLICSPLPALKSCKAYLPLTYPERSDFTPVYLSGPHCPPSISPPDTKFGRIPASQAWKGIGFMHPLSSLVESNQMLTGGRQA